ncbi:hypothetical protein CDN99_03130 [Roseateles aquatilis]|uniref:DUF2442 domain-containing protein n=1 Tax=Roseateles aquatilis TaxID=431061 RepID=A0A246JLI1_9BURK|nr:DUF2442 domain-containing protein [Roseateles aquatilis]OWQ93481.1 hypothetical protein CDN99_03130 [Roseateles aquatilis]
MRSPQFTLTSVTPTPRASLLLAFADGEHFDVDLVDVIKTFRVFAPLKSQSVFNTARLGEFADTVIWADDDNLELAADNLRAMAVEQTGGISHEFIYRWMHENDLNLDTAAEALGMSRRMLAYYRSGAKPVPRTVALACLGWEALRKWPASRQLPLAA